MFPFYQQTSQVEEFMKFWKFLDEYQKSQKPKDKMVPAGEQWSTADYFVLYWTIGNTAWIITTIIILHQIQEIVKAWPH